MLATSVLSYVMHTDAPLPIEKIRNIFVQLAVGVHALHLRGYCCMDFSLDNAGLTRDASGHVNLVKLFDLGMVRRFPGEMWSEGWTVFPPVTGGKYIGKEMFYPPEYHYGREWCGKQRDIFALGIGLYIMLTQRT